MLEETRQEPIKAGTIFYISSGEYSSYSVHDVFLALKDIDDPDALVEAHTAPAKYTSLGPDVECFLYDDLVDSMIRAGLIRKIDAIEWYIDDYYRV